MEQRIALMMLSAGATVADDTKLYASPQGNGETWLLDSDGNKLGSTIFGTDIHFILKRHIGTFFNYSVTK